MSIAPYGEYKDSAVPGLGSIPAHWGCKAIKHVATVDNSGSYGVDVEDAEISLPVATTAQIGSDGKFEVDKMPVRGFSAEDVIRYGCSPNDILVVKSSGSATNIISGKAGIVDNQTEKFVFSNFLLRIKPNEKAVDPKFLYSLVRSQLTRQRVEQMCSTTTYPNLQVGEYVSALLPVPPLEEQKLITAFLDRETAKIDALVAEQRRLIELLKEKRQAVISHAVTKGLNPNVPIKPSGIDWLGDLPSHWRAAKLGHLATKIVDGAHFTPTYVDEGVPFLRVTDITSRRIDLSDVKRIPLGEHEELSKRCNPAKGDLLLSKNGTIGVPKVVEWDWEFSIFVSLCLIKLRPILDAQFARYVFLSSSVEMQINEGIKQSTVTNLHLEKIAAFRFPLPPTDEQTEIVRHLDCRVGEFETLIREAESALNLLQERRAALISAAVTGQIDVQVHTPELVPA